MIGLDLLRIHVFTFLERKAHFSFSRVCKPIWNISACQSTTESMMRELMWSAKPIQFYGTIGHDNLVQISQFFSRTKQLTVNVESEMCGVQALAGMTTLEFLDITCHPWLSSDVGTLCRTLTKLKTLKIYGQISTDCLENDGLKNNRTLTSLTVSGFGNRAHGTPWNPAWLKDVPLETLVVTHPFYIPVGNLALITTLTKLDIRGTGKLFGSQIVDFKGMKLNDLRCDVNFPTDDSAPFEFLANQLPLLEVLILQGWLPHPRLACTHLSRLEHLRVLELTPRGNVFGHDRAGQFNLPKLEWLFLRLYDFLNDENMACIKNSPSLRHLQMFDPVAELSDKGFVHLQHHPGLEILSLAPVYLTNESVAVLNTLKNLFGVRIQTWTRVTEIEDFVSGANKLRDWPSKYC